MVCRRELAWTYGDGTLTSRRILGPWMWGWALTLMSLRDPHLPWGYFRGRGGGGAAAACSAGSKDLAGLVVEQRQPYPSAPPPFTDLLQVVAAEVQG